MNIPTELIDPLVNHVKQSIRAETIKALDGALGISADNGDTIDDGDTLTFSFPKVRLDAPKPGTAATPAAVLSYLKSHPKTGTADLRTALKADPKPALAELREAKRIRMTGVRRGARYSAK